MKTLQVLADELTALVQDWFNGKERELHRHSALALQQAAKEVEDLRLRTAALEETVQRIQLTAGAAHVSKQL